MVGLVLFPGFIMVTLVLNVIPHFWLGKYRERKLVISLKSITSRTKSVWFTYTKTVHKSRCMGWHNYRCKVRHGNGVRFESIILILSDLELDLWDCFKVISERRIFRSLHFSNQNIGISIYFFNKFNLIIILNKHV